MSRRVHKKSRNGCTECKRRHLKCDETFPICVNCKTAGRSCSFPQKQLTPQPALAYSSPAITTPADSPILSQDQRTQKSQQYVVNLEHMDLLCHFHTETSKDFNSGPESVMSTFKLFTQYNTSAPYLLYEILAIASLHKSFLCPTQQEYYHAYATGFQNQALTLFNNMVTGINEFNCAPALIFSSMTGLHVLCETMRYRPDDPDIFLDRFTHFLTLHQGVRVVARSSWETLKQSEQLKPFLEVPERTNHVAAAENQPGSECAPLNDMIREADLARENLESYELAIKHLQWAFDMNRYARSMSDSKQMMLTWTIIVPTKYVELLTQRRPEALVILTYYGALLLRHQDFWAVGDGGRLLIESIRKLLGRYWEPWLAWPVEEITRLQA